MRVKLWLSAVVLALVAFSSNAHALSYRDSTQKTFLQTPMSGFNVSTSGAVYTLLAGQGTPITGIAISNGATAGILSLYDANTTAGFGAGSSISAGGPSECVFETAVAASTASYVDLSAAPINTNYGIVLVQTGTVGSVVYTAAGNANR